MVKTSFTLKLGGYGVEHGRWKLNPKASLPLNLGAKGGVWDELEGLEFPPQRGKLSMKASLEKSILKSENELVYFYKGKGPLYSNGLQGPYRF